MAEDNDRIEQIRARRSKGRVSSQEAAERQAEIQQRIRQGGQVGRISGTPRGVPGGLRGGTQSVWLQDRVTLSLEAQIAMIEMRGAYKLTLADLGYHNRLKIISIRPGIFLKVEPTGCYKMAYHNRL